MTESGPLVAVGGGVTPFTSVGTDPDGAGVSTR